MTHRGSQAARDVLTNPDLAEKILAYLPRPRLVAPTRDPATKLVEVQFPDRFAASHVNSTLRRAALGLPWGALWNDEHSVAALTYLGSPGLPKLAIHAKRNGNFRLHAPDPEWSPACVNSPPGREAPRPRCEAGLEAEHSPASTLSALLGLLQSRDTQSLEVVLRQAASLAVCAALLRCSPRSLVVLVVEEACLANWLQHSRVPLDRHRRGGPGDSAPVLGYLSSLTRLTSLTVNAKWSYWQHSSWLAAVTQLRHIKMAGYAGAPLGALPSLESLEVQYTKYTGLARGRLTEVEVRGFASPRLTSLALRDCVVLSAARPSSSPSAVAPAGGWPARGSLQGLQRLELRFCQLGLEHCGLQELLPGLTGLSLRDCDVKDVVNAFAQGLPATLLELVLECSLRDPGLLWPTLSVLSNLVSLKLKLKATALDGKGVQVAVEALSRLPKLRWGALSLTTAHKSKLEGRFGDLKAVLERRGGRLDLDLIPLLHTRGAAW